MSNIFFRNISWLYSKVRSRFYKRDRGLWVFGEWFGSRCCDNSLYLANHVAQNHPQIKVVWIAKKDADLSMLHPGIRIIEMDTPEAQELLHRAGVAVMNQGLCDFSSEVNYYCDGALTVNLWHGVPWKHIGTDVLQTASFPKKLYGYYLQWLQRSDVYLATSDDFQNIFRKKYFAKRGGVILSGYPRNSIFYSSETVEACRKKAVQKLCTENPELEGEIKIITYMPTFRDYTQELFSFRQLAEDTRLQEILEKHNAVVVQRAHFVTSRRGDDHENGCGRITTLDGITSQELLAASDMLVTDYSSCFFDFLMLDRPVLHHLYDYDYYANQDRGLYYKKEEVACGDVSQTVEELLDNIERNLSCPNKETVLRKNRREIFMTYECADCCEKIYEEILRRQK